MGSETASQILETIITVPAKMGRIPKASVKKKNKNMVTVWPMMLYPKSPRP